MNSPLVNNRIQARPGTVLGQILSTAPNERAALGGLYLRVLSRQPTPGSGNLRAGTYRASATRREAFEDIYWSLINSTEFLTRARADEKGESSHGTRKKKRSTWR